MDLPSNLTSKKFTTECISSATDPNLAYISAIYKGSDNYKLSVCKFDFKANSAKVISETIDNDHIKNIKKSVDEAYKKTGDLALGEVFQFEVQHMAEYNGTIVVSFGDRGSQDPPYQLIQSTIINGYDEDLNQKFQQVMPSSTVYGPTSNIETGYYYRDNKLCVTANTGNMRFRTLYGQLDLSTGKWITLRKLEKEKIDGSDFLTGNNLWYKDSFVLIYVPFKNGYNSRIDLSIQQNSY